MDYSSLVTIVYGCNITKGVLNLRHKDMAAGLFLQHYCNNLPKESSPFILLR